MTTKRTPKTKTDNRAPLPDKFKGFVNIPLTESLKKDILLEQEDAEAFEKHLDALHARGFKVTFSPPDANGSYQVTATGTENSGQSSGYATSARSDDTLRALLALSGKVIVVADSDLSTFVSSKLQLNDI